MTTDMENWFSKQFFGEIFIQLQFLRGHITHTE